MNLLGIHLKLLIGQEVPVIAPLKINEALQQAEVTHSDQGRSGFQLTFQIGRGLKDFMDYSLVKEDLLKPFRRVIIVVIFNITPKVLMDGIITNQQISAGSDPGASTLTVTGEDISLMMDLEQKPQDYPTLTDNMIVNEILRSPSYAQYNLLPDATSSLPVPVNPPPNPVDETPIQPMHTTDLDYIQMLAERYGFVFYVKPGEAPGTNIAYWGAPIRRGVSQRALSVNMGPNTTVESINFQYNGLNPQKVIARGELISSVDESRLPQLARYQPEIKRVIHLEVPDGLTDEQTRMRAQSQVNRSLDEVVTGTGELDALRYGRLLEPRGLVDVRGAGKSLDGTYYVKNVTHRIDVRKGEYRQSFTITREGLGTLTPMVRS